MLNQWHTTEIINRDGRRSFLKKYIPNSYEVGNEISWLSSSILGGQSIFRIPLMYSSSKEDGYVEMEYIDTLDDPFGMDNKQDIIIEIASSLHGLMNTQTPRVRSREVVSLHDYYAYLRNYCSIKFDGVIDGGYCISEIKDWIITRIGNLKVPYFTIVHRDLRLRHILLSGAKKPALIDWEFTNISDPAQDVAKIICDIMESKDSFLVPDMEYVLNSYSYIRGISKDELMNRVIFFIPIILIEQIYSLINRQPDGFLKKIDQLMSLLLQFYETYKQ